jgi:two-component system, probable response regulator PhcQ
MPRLMLVDDEPNVLTSLRRTISAIPPRTFGEPLLMEAFAEPSLALERASECVFDLVISDYRMPVMSGIEFLARLIEVQPLIAKIMLSGYADLRALMAAINEVSVYRFVAKPWDNGDLRGSVVQALGHRQALLENQRLADTLRLQRGTISEQELELKLWEEECPGLTKVERADDGSVYLDWRDAGSLSN